MRNLPDPRTLSAVPWHTTATVNRTGETYPVLEGRLAVSEDAQVPERLDMGLPPGAELHPYGDRVTLTLHLEVPGEPVTAPLGQYIVTEVTQDEKTTRIEAAGLLRAVDDAGWATPYQQPVTQAAGHVITGILGQFNVPTGRGLIGEHIARHRVFDDTPMTVVTEIAGLIPARVRTGWDGLTRVLPPLIGTVTTQPRIVWGPDNQAQATCLPMSRTGIYSHVIVEGADVVCEEEITTGPLAVCQYGRVTQRIVSTDIDSYAQAQLMARAQLDASRIRARRWEVTCIPDWRVDTGDPVELATPSGPVWGVVTGVEYPLSVKDAVMTAHVGEGI